MNSVENRIITIYLLQKNILLKNTWRVLQEQELQVCMHLHLFLLPCRKTALLNGYPAIHTKLNREKFVDSNSFGLMHYKHFNSNIGHRVSTRVVYEYLFHSQALLMHVRQIEHRLSIMLLF